MKAHHTDGLAPPACSGGADDAILYSGGVRQAVVELHANASGFRINPEGGLGYHDEMRSALFGLAPYGAGWGGKHLVEVGRPLV